MLRLSRYPEPVLQAVRAHHERLDGAGYPKRLRGSGVPWMARALAIAEVFDALTNPQPWPEPLAPAPAFRLMLYQAVGALDQPMLRAFAPSLMRPNGEAE